MYHTLVVVVFLYIYTHFFFSSFCDTNAAQDATIAAIVDAADSPLSIVIVGVGEGDFTAMERLDGDRQRLVSPFTGKEASRDMVQFVPFRDFDGFGSAAQHALAKHVLAEIPGQFIQYMETHGIAPANKRTPGRAIPGLPQRGERPGVALGAGGLMGSPIPGIPFAAAPATQQTGADDLPPPYVP